jgi:hypothetical protein
LWMKTREYTLGQVDYSSEPARNIVKIDCTQESIRFNWFPILTVLPATSKHFQQKLKTMDFALSSSSSSSSSRPMGGSSQRLTTRHTEAQDRRNQMTRRRHELSNKIRKQKKSQYLAQKRNLVLPLSDTTATTANVPTTTTTTREEAVAIAEINTSIQNFGQNPSIELLQALEQALRNLFYSTKVHAPHDNPLVFLRQDQAPMAVTVLNRLGQSLQSAPSEDDAWLLVLHTLVHLTSISILPPNTAGLCDDEGSYYQQSPETWCTSLLRVPELLQWVVSMAHQREAACVILGNLASDPSHDVRQALHQVGIVPALVAAIKAPSTTTSLVGAATWALTNAIRHDTTSWAKTYCSEDLLSPALLEQLLVFRGGAAEDPLLVAASGIHQQTAWMIASLTSREPEVVEYLCSHASFCGTLINALELSLPSSSTATVAGGHDDPRLPLIQALGHIASYAAHIPSLLSLNLAPLVRHTLQTGYQIRGPVFAQTAWLAGCLLCDAGIIDHPSTHVAAPILIPVLVDLLSPETGSLLPLEEKREVICALWNALAAPPSPEEYPSEYGRSSFMSSRAATPPLPNVQALCRMFPTLVDAMGSTDADSTLGAIHVVNVLLRREGTEKILMRTAFEEAMGQEGLEKLCDSNLHEAAAEVAANLLDDLFLNDRDDDDDNDDGIVGLGGGWAGNAPGFGGRFHSVRESAPQIEAVGRGQGRGRGATLPSWMAQK